MHFVCYDYLILTVYVKVITLYHQLILIDSCTMMVFKSLVGPILSPCNFSFEFHILMQTFSIREVKLKLQQI
uniref:Uncharacterized protein n=1 Tax=Rhizophora mucronata TaxID=61149 RepID=A0A2P2KV03_RHIMU